MKKSIIGKPLNNSSIADNSVARKSIGRSGDLLNWSVRGKKIVNKQRNDRQNLCKHTVQSAQVLSSFVSIFLTNIKCIGWRCCFPKWPQKRKQRKFCGTTDQI